MQVVATLKLVLLALFAAIALYSAWQALRATSQNLEMLADWPREPAVITGLALPGVVEFTVARRFVDGVPGAVQADSCSASDATDVCLLLPRRPQGWYSLWSSVDLAQDPAAPARVEILEPVGLWAAVVARLVLVLVLAAAGSALAKSGWGEDRTWFDGRWIPTDEAGARIGFSTPDAELIRETPASRKAVIVWSVLFLAIAVFVVGGSIRHFSQSPLEAVLLIMVASGVLALALDAAFATHTRRIHQDASGVRDATIFRVERVPWTAVATIALENLNLEAQRDYDRKSMSARKNSSRPVTLNAWIARAADGSEVLRLTEDMNPGGAFRALIERLGAQGRAAAASRAGATRAAGTRGATAPRAPLRGAATLRDGTPEADESAAEMETEAEAIAHAEFEDGWPETAAPPRERRSIFHPDHRGLLLGLAAMLAPFVLITAWLAYRTLWFQHAAARADGRVIEVRREGLPQLVIEYRPHDGKALRIESDGSNAYASYRAGDTIRVFYDRAEPERARIDLFLELWLGTLIMSGLSAIVLLLAVLIARGFTAALPGL